MKTIFQIQTARGRPPVLLVKGWAPALSASIVLFLLCFTPRADATEIQQRGLLPEPGPRAAVPVVSAPLRDPFHPGGGRFGSLYPPSVDPGQLNLQAILFDAGESKALISGQVVGKGDQLFDYTVSKIQPGKVSLQRGKNNYYLFLVLSHEMR